MGTEAQRLKELGERLKYELDQLKQQKKESEEASALKEQQLQAAKTRLAELKEAPGGQARYDAILNELREEAKASREIQKSELHKSWIEALEMLEAQRRAYEMQVDATENSKRELHKIKLSLRERGVADFQNYSPSNIGDSPPTSAKYQINEPPPVNSPSFGKPFNEETDVKIADHAKSPINPEDIIVANVSPGSKSPMPPSPMPAVALHVTEASPAASPAFGKPFDENVDVLIADHKKSPLNINEIVVANVEGGSEEDGISAAQEEEEEEEDQDLQSSLVPTKSSDVPSPAAHI